MSHRDGEELSHTVMFNVHLQFDILRFQHLAHAYMTVTVNGLAKFKSQWYFEPAWHLISEYLGIPLNRLSVLLVVSMLLLSHSLSLCRTFFCETRYAIT